MNNNKTLMLGIWLSKVGLNIKKLFSVIAYVSNFVKSIFFVDNIRKWTTYYIVWLDYFSIMCFVTGKMYWYVK